MLFRPIQTIALFFIKIIIKRYNPSVSSAFIKIFKLLFGSTTMLVTSVGVMPVFTVLWKLRKYVFNSSTNINRIMVMVPGLNTFVVRTITDAINPYWNDCISHPILFRRIYNIFLFTSFLGFFKPIVFWFFRLIMGLILSSIGILWNESLNSVTYLRNFSNWVLGLLENNTSFNIPRAVPSSNLTSLDLDVDDDIDLNSYSWLSLIGFMLITSVGILGLICITDYIIPDVVR